MKLSRRNFFGLLGVSFAASVIPKKQSKAHSKKEKAEQALKVGKCPKCKYPMYLPTPCILHEAVRGKYQKVMLACKCPQCGFKMTEEVLCSVQPRIIRG